MKHGPGFEGVQLPFEGRLNCSGIPFVGKKTSRTNDWMARTRTWRRDSMMSVAILEIIRLGGELPLEVLYRMRMIDSVQLPPRVWKCLCMRIIDIYKMYVLIYIIWSMILMTIDSWHLPTARKKRLCRSSLGCNAKSSRPRRHWSKRVLRATAGVMQRFEVIAKNLPIDKWWPGDGQKPRIQQE